MKASNNTAKGTILLWTILHGTLFLELAIITWIIFRLRYIWPDINEVVTGATGIMVNWVLLILLVTALAGIFLIYLLLSDLLLRVPVALWLGKIVPAVIFVIWTGLLGALISETGEFIFPRAEKGYTLPDLMTAADGAGVSTPEEWESRRAEILRMFEEHVYGPVPPPPEVMDIEVRSLKTDALGGKSTRKEVTLYFTKDRSGPAMTILLYLPNNAAKPVPLFFGLNFYGNHTATSEIEVALARGWLPNKRKYGIVDHRATEKSRGVRDYRWPAEMVNGSGYGLATAYCGDLDPDFDDGFKNGIHPLFYGEGKEQSIDRAGTISAWAWGILRAIDYFERDEDIDHNRIAVMGHSRLGKTSLWAGANDPRISLVISNESGSMGAAISRRMYGETIEYINTTFPHWFCENFSQYMDNEESLPVDQHMLIALVAPRPVYIASAKSDHWSDPEGEFLGAYHSSPAWRVYGLPGLDAVTTPPVHEPVHSIVGYHVRKGFHEVTVYDWKQFVDFADKYMVKRR